VSAIEQPTARQLARCRTTLTPSQVRDDLYRVDAAMLDRVPVTGRDQVGQRHDGVRSDGNDPSSQRTLILGLFEQADPHHQDHVRSTFHGRGLWPAVEGFFEERAVRTFR
jgi:hypothetical protein